MPTPPNSGVPEEKASESESGQWHWEKLASAIQLGVDTVRGALPDGFQSPAVTSPANSGDEKPASANDVPDKSVDIANMPYKLVDAVRDALPVISVGEQKEKIVRSVADKGLDIAKAGNKLGFDCADGALRIVQNGMDYIGQSDAKRGIHLFRNTVRGIGQFTDATLAVGKHLNVTPWTAFDILDVEDTQALQLFREALPQESELDAETLFAALAVLKTVARFGNVEGPSLIEIPRLYATLQAVKGLQYLTNAKVPRGKAIKFFEEESREIASLRPRVCCYGRFAFAAFRREVLELMGVPAVRKTDEIEESLEETIARYTGLKTANDIVRIDESQREALPSYYIALDHSEKNIVVCFRGTLTLQDVLLDLVCEHRAIPNGRKTATVHGGMWDAATKLATLLRPEIDRLIAEYKYGVVVCGYSLGAGVATLLTRIWHTNMKNLHCYAYAPPCTVSSDIADMSYVTSIIAADDVVPRLGYVAAEMLRDTILKLNPELELKQRIADAVEKEQLMAADFANHAGGKDRKEQEARRKWADKVMQDTLIKDGSPRPPNSRLVPAGRLFWFPQALEKATGPVEVRDVAPDHLGAILLTRSMVSAHMPASYVSILRL